MNFKDFDLSPQLKRAIDDAGYVEATEIQERSIPLILEGKDVIGFSQTGSGKTAAFGLPAIDFLDFSLNTKRTQVLILCPTRELAMQGAEELKKFSKYIENLHIVSVYGGQPIDSQFNQLRRGCQIVIGTPGRVMDHLRRRTIRLGELKMVILDEADEMLNMGFREDIETILEKTPEERQTILFSATMPKEILDITKQYQKDAVLVEVKQKAKTVDTIEQSYFEIARGRKKDALALLLQYYNPSLCMVFCNTKKMVDEVVEELSIKGFAVQGLHGDVKQQQRTRIMNQFKNGGFNVLVATDVAARGIDVNDIDLVINFDIPQDNEYYVHRIGRTGRAGKSGKSFTLVVGRGQKEELNRIMKYIKCDIPKSELPRLKDVTEQNMNSVITEIKNHIENNDVSSQSETLEKLVESGMDYSEIALALLDMRCKNDGMGKNIDSIGDDIRVAPRKEYTRDHKRKERYSNKKAEEKFKDVDMDKITISIGRSSKVAPKHILGAVAGESGLPGSIMGSIDIQRDYTTVDVPREYKKRIIKSLNNKTIKNKKVRVK